MSKKIIIILLLGIMFLKPDNISAASNKCSPEISPLTNCTQTTPESANFKDPSIDTIEKNKCSNYTEKPNKYCTTYCREEAKTIFPKTINPMSVDRYQPILGGSHFQWEKSSIISTKECKTVIDYNKWENDYVEADQKLEAVTEQLLKEWHQLLSDVECGTPEFNRIVSNYAGAMGLGSGAINYVKYVLGGRKCGCSGSTRLNDKYLETMPWTDYIFSDYYNNQSNYVIKEEFKSIVIPKGKWTKKQCGGASQGMPGQAYLCADIEDGYNKPCPSGYAGKFGEYYRENSNGTLVKECSRVKISEKQYQKGKWRAYELATFDPGPGAVFAGRLYCDADELPYFDTELKLNGRVDKEWIESSITKWESSYDTVKRNISQKIAELRQCNSISATTETATPYINVYYQDPTNNYTLKGQTKKITLKAKKTSTVKSDDGTVKAQKYYNSGLVVTECKVPESYKNVTKEMMANPCTVKYDRKYDSLRNVVVQKKVTDSYDFAMPSNIFRYTLKETGEAVDSNSPKVTQAVKDNYRYVDVGYPNYPVHYTTPTGEYPIYLTYSNLGTKGYWTNKLPNKTGRYDCTYKVVNRIIPCPDGECPPCVGPDCDNKCPPGDPNCPGSGQGINVIYRPISLTEPFPGYDANRSSSRRESGENWTKKDEEDYILNNRGAKANGVYNLEPLYSFTLDAKALRAIRDYNKSKDPETKKVREYNDFNLTCSSEKNGKRCMSKFLKGIKSMIGSGNASGTCLGASSGNFYACANKPNQDKIKCGLNKDNKMECTNCYFAANKNKAACKNITEGSGK